MNAAHTEMLARWAPQRQMTLAQARRRSSFIGMLRMVFVAGAAISAGVIIGPIAATTMSGAGQQIDQLASDEVVTMVNARFTGRNIAGEAYVITAEEARRRRADPTVINLTNPRLVDDKGTQVSAPVGVFYQNEEYLDLFQDVKVRDAEGYEFTTTAARAFVQGGRIQGLEPLNGNGPLGDVRADSYEIEDEGDRIIFRGNVDLTIYPDGKDDTETTETESAQVSGEGGPIRVNADRSEVLDKERKVLLIDNVDITQGTARLRSDLVTLEYGGGGDTTTTGLGSSFGDIRTMTARGNVFYITPDLKANGDVGVYVASTDTITMTGNIILVRGDDVAKGERLTIELAAGKTTLDGGGSQVNMVIVPGEEDGR